jgi:hypothetical protein
MNLSIPKDIILPKAGVNNQITDALIISMSKRAKDSRKCCRHF